MIELTSHSFLHRRVRRLKESIYKRITSNSDFFLRPSDIISNAPIIHGLHEPAVHNLLMRLSKNNIDNFLIDIGANIGLTSCQARGLFKKFHLFEPNPLALNILKTNCHFMLENYVIHDYALGKTSENSNITIPKKNMGGAFIKHQDNFYDEDFFNRFARKEGHKDYRSANYACLPIRIEPTITNIEKIIKEASYKPGIIKIDTEGYEQSILEDIAKIIPSDMQAIIIFENHSHQFSPNNLTSLFSGNARLYSITQTKHYKSKLRRYLGIFDLMQHLQPTETGNIIGDLCLALNTDLSLLRN